MNEIYREFAQRLSAIERQRIELEEQAWHYQHCLSHCWSEIANLDWEAKIIGKFLCPEELEGDEDDI